MKKLLLTGIAALFLATGTAHAELGVVTSPNTGGVQAVQWSLPA